MIFKSQYIRAAGHLYTFKSMFKKRFSIFTSLLMSFAEMSIHVEEFPYRKGMMQEFHKRFAQINQKVGWRTKL